MSVLLLRLTQRTHSSCARVADWLSEPNFIQFDPWSIWFYLVCAFLFILSVSLNLNGSSIGIYHSLYHRGAHYSPITGHPHWIRIDEWGFHTPAIINQVVRDKSFDVEHSALGDHSVSLLGNIPVAHLTTLFRPQFWPFFTLPLDYAFSAYWQFKAFILVTGVFTWLLLMTGSTLWSVSGALWFFFSPAVQWEYSWASLLPEMIGSICFLFVCAAYLTVAQSKLKITLASTGFIVCTINFGLCAYLPHILPLIWLAAFAFAGWLVSARRAVFKLNGSRLRGGAILFSVALILVVTAVTYPQVREAVTAINNTAYPGHRISEGNPQELIRVLDNFFDWFHDEAHYPNRFLNICECAGFLWLCPVTLMLIPRIWRSQEHRWKFVSICAMLFLATICLLAPLKGGLIHALLLDREFRNRSIPAMGLANIALVAIAMSIPREWSNGLADSPRWFRPPLEMLFSFPLIGSLLVFANLQLLWYHTWMQILIAALITAVLCTLLIEHRSIALALLVVVPSMLLYGGVNPVSRGLEVVTSSELFKFMRSDPGFLRSKWLVFSDELWPQAFFGAAGCDVYDGLRYLPDVDHFGLLKSGGLTVNSFNRSGYLLAHPLGPGQETFARVIQEGWVQWDVSPIDPLLRQLGIKYIAFDQKPSRAIRDRLNSLSQIPVDGMWLFEFKK